MTESPGQGNQRTPPIWVLPCGSDGRALVRMPRCHLTPGACDDRAWQADPAAPPERASGAGPARAPPTRWPVAQPQPMAGVAPAGRATALGRHCRASRSAPRSSLASPRRAERGSRADGAAPDRARIPPHRQASLWPARPASPTSRPGGPAGGPELGPPTPASGRTTSTSQAQRLPWARS
ncbi:hypothetical protein J1605_015783 [Eschrichtius robustus]|uniref:Uncharacterized protein n=1 Tax=Eschrichtius robustus TaxID=9764 RepID=A0AB34GAE6_ESCRO|nr:hypothetical protein J1605_015783 [Eschrichtius robustus]